MKTVASIFMVSLLAGCATPPAAPMPPPAPIVRTVTVDHPIPVPCVSAVPDEPAYPDSDAALHSAPDVFTGVKLLLAGRITAHDYIAQLRAILSACAGKPQ
jgi:hypothetical protein